MTMQQFTKTRQKAKETDISNQNTLNVVTSITLRAHNHRELALLRGAFVHHGLQHPHHLCLRLEQCKRLTTH